MPAIQSPQNPLDPPNTAFFTLASASRPIASPLVTVDRPVVNVLIGEKPPLIDTILGVKKV
jgi:hypothetical protein